MKKKIVIIIGCFLVILFVAGLLITSGLSEGMKVQLTGIDLSEVEDGSYKGEYNFKRWSNSVTVEVKDNKIISISIDKDVFGADVTACSDEIIAKVIKEQNTTVDVVTGATVTSKAYLKAIENALKNDD